MQIKIRQLRAFDAAVRLGSFVEAANALHVTAAALSLTIRELEEGVGFRVLERTTRRLHLTDAGSGYLAFTRRVLAELDAADRYAKDVLLGHSVVRIATTQTVIATLLSLALHDLHSEFPHIKLQPLDVAAGGILDALVEGKADIAIGVNLPSDGEFESIPLFLSRWFAYLAPAHPLSQRRRLAWSDVADQCLYMTKSSNYLRLRATLGKGLDLANVQESMTATAGLAMAASGSGIAVFPGYAQPLARILGVKGVPIESPPVRHELQIGVRRQAATSAPIVGIRNTLVKLVNGKCLHLK
jgi:DNA-binding transcriptional LysR family regulator